MKPSGNLNTLNIHLNLTNEIHYIKNYIKNKFIKERSRDTHRFLKGDETWVSQFCPGTPLAAHSVVDGFGRHLNVLGSHVASLVEN